MHVTCACTVPRASAPSIAAGKTEFFDLVYRTDTRTHDATKAVTIEFKEAQAPLVRLVVSAKVREPVTPFVREILFDHHGQKTKLTREFNVYNYGDCDWSSLLVHSFSKWLNAEAKLQPRNGRALKLGDPRQVWRVNVQAKTSELSFGNYHGELQLKPQETTDKQSIVSVRLQLSPPVRAIPNQFFFGVIRGGITASRNVRVIFAKHISPVDAAKTTVKHTLASGFGVSWTQTEGRVWELTASISPSGADKFISGKVEIHFAEHGLPPLTLHALVQ